MKIVIDIPEELYKRVKAKYIPLPCDFADVMDKAITNGTIEPQGEWIEHFDSSSGFTWRTCSRCMFKDGKKYYKFCPNCGAYMRGKEE